MIIACHMKVKFVLTEVTENNKELLNQAIWIDLINPTKEEELLIESCLGYNIPTLEEMREIELSSRLYKEDGILFMTAIMIAQSESNTPKQDAVTFLLTSKQLISIRYIKPQAFSLFALRINKLQVDSAAFFFIELLDTTVDRLADILEMLSHELENASKSIFHPKQLHQVDYKDLLQQLGWIEELNSKIVQSLVSFNRLLHFFAQTMNGNLEAHEHERVNSLSNDINSLNDHASFLSNKISFLLEATLGMVQIDQNAIIKIFSVAAVIFLPPTLIASIYGMNFRFMPELSWKYGYVIAIGLMIFAAWLPFKYFKYRKWL